MRLRLIKRPRPTGKECSSLSLCHLFKVLFTATVLSIDTLFDFDGNKCRGSKVNYRIYTLQKSLFVASIKNNERWHTEALRLLFLNSSEYK